MKEIQQKTQSTRDKSEKDNVNHSKRTFFVNLTIHITYLLIKMTLLATLLFTLLSIQLPLFKQTNSYLRVQENLWLWEKQIIVEFRIVDGQICPSEFEDFVTYQWPGNIKGCYCQINIGLYKYVSILQGECGQLQFENGCMSIPANEKMKYAYWLYGVHVCVRRLKNYNFYTSLDNIINLNNHLSKFCAEDQPYQINLIDPIECPITNIVNTSIFPEQIKELQFSYDRQSNYPIVYFRIAEDNFCQQLMSDTVSPGRHSNYIIQRKTKFQCSHSDQRTIFIQEKLETQLFDSNPNIKKKIQSLPGYPALDEHFKYKLGFVRYPQWKYKCRISSQLSLLNAKNHLNLQFITLTITVFTYIIIFSTVMAFITVLLNFIDLYVHLRLKYINGYLYLKDYQIKNVDNRSNLLRNRYNQGVKFLLSQLFIIMGLVTLVIYYTKTIDQILWFEQSLPCTSQPFVSYLDDYRNFYSSNAIYLMTSIFINTSILIIDIFHIFYRFCKGDLQKQAEKQQIRQKQDITESTVNNDLNQANHNFTEENLIQNSFLHYPIKQQGQILQIINDDNIDQSSEYSKSASQ